MSEQKWPTIYDEDGMRLLLGDAPPPFTFTPMGAIAHCAHPYGATCWRCSTYATGANAPFSNPIPMPEGPGPPRSSPARGSHEKLL